MRCNGTVEGDCVKRHDVNGLTTQQIPYSNCVVAAGAESSGAVRGDRHGGDGAGVAGEGVAELASVAEIPPPQGLVMPAADRSSAVRCDRHRGDSPLVPGEEVATLAIALEIPPLHGVIIAAADRSSAVRRNRYRPDRIVIAEGVTELASVGEIPPPETAVIAAAEGLGAVRRWSCPGSVDTLTLRTSRSSVNRHPTNSSRGATRRTAPNAVPASKKDIDALRDVAILPRATAPW